MEEVRGSNPLSSTTLLSAVEITPAGSLRELGPRPFRLIPLPDEENVFGPLAMSLVRAAVGGLWVDRPWVRAGIDLPSGFGEPVPGYGRVGLAIGSFEEVVSGATLRFGDTATSIFFPLPPDLGAVDPIPFGRAVFSGGGLGHPALSPFERVSITVVTFDENQDFLAISEERIPPLVLSMPPRQAEPRS